MSGSTRSYEFGSRLVRMGHQVTMITSWRTEPNGSRKSFTSQEGGMTIIWIPVLYSNHMDYFHRIIAFFKFMLLSFRVALKIESDLVFASSTPLTVALPGIFASYFHKAPFVLEVRDLWPEIPIAIGALNNPLMKSLAYGLEKYSYRNSRQIVALSDGMKAGIIKRGYPPEKITVVSNASDLDNFDPFKIDKVKYRIKYGIPNNSIVVLYPGTLGKVNGVTYLTKIALKFFDDSRIAFVTVGDGQEFEKVRAEAESNGCLNHNFFMFHQISKAEIPLMFACADIVISTIIPLVELEANSANKFFDGLAAGCCIAINHKGWQSELITKHKCGITLSQDIDEAKAQLEELIKRPERIHCAGRRARQVAELCFDRNKLTKILESVFTKALDNGNN